nr:SH3 domain-containing protein [uncultured Carboxylicivirga sp.]
MGYNISWKFLIYTIFLCNFNLSIIAQSEFRNFINSFKEYKWDELTGPSRYLNVKDTINYEYANRNMWGEHTAKYRQQTVNLSYPTKAPHIRNIEGKYAEYHNGFHGLYNNGIKTSDGFIKSNLYSIGKIYITEDIVLLILKYEYYDPEEGHSSSIEAFTFRISDEQMISAINLTNTARTFIEKNETITSYEDYYFPTDDPSIDEGYVESKCKIIYRIDNDGYFNQIVFEESEKEGYLYLGKINDVDGWANVRETPDLNSAVLYKAINGKYVYVEKLKDSNWCRILMYKESRDNRKVGGYIHESRVKKIEL